MTIRRPELDRQLAEARAILVAMNEGGIRRPRIVSKERRNGAWWIEVVEEVM